MINKVYLYLMLRNWISAFVLVLITSLSSLSFAQDKHASKTTPLSPAQIKMKDSLYQVLASQKEDSNKVETLLAIHILWRLNDSDSGLTFANKAIQLAESIDYKAGAMNAYLLEGIIYYKIDKLKDALKCFIAAYPFAEEMNNYKKMLSLCNNISVISIAQGDYNEALKYTSKMLEINKKHFKNSAMYQCGGNLNIGIIMKEQGKYREALNFYRKALPIAMTNPEDSKQLKLKHGAILDGMGTVYHKLHLLDSAKYCFSKAIKVRQDAKHEVGVATTNTNYAQVLMEEGNYKLALSQLSFALATYQTQEVNLQIAKTGLIIAEVKILQKEYSEAISMINKSLRALQEENSKIEVKEAYKLLARAFSGLGNYRKAYTYEKMYGNIKDTIYNGEMAEQLAEMRTSFELEKQEERIKHLNEREAINKDKLEAEKTISMYITIGFIIFAVFALIIFFVINQQYQIKKRSNEILQKQKEEILERNVEINAQKEEILIQRDMLEELNEDVTASIRYAKRLQDAILPPDSYIKSTLSNAFVLYKPKDIVSGDFYWVHQIGDFAMFAVVDCTGHGVPGAFMSLVGNDALSIAVADMENPEASNVLNLLNLEVTKRLHQDSDDNSVKDGMDIGLCIINKKTLELQFAGAYNPAYIIRKGALHEIKGDPFAIGMFVGEEVRPFTNNKYQLEKDDMVYVFSDGYADQFGGPRGKKFKYKPFKEILLTHSEDNADKQKEVLDTRLTEWMLWEGRPEEPQIDDVCIMGIRI